MKKTNEYDNGLYCPANFEKELYSEIPVYYVPTITFKNKRKKEKIEENRVSDSENELL